MKNSNGAKVPFWKKQLLEFFADLNFLGRGLLIILSLMAILLVSNVAMIAVNQERLIFKPRPGFSEHLDIWGFEDHALNLPWLGGQARAHYFEKAQSELVLIFCYGNADNINNCIERLRWLSKQANCSIFVADYPGYGSTPGEPSQQAIGELMHAWSGLLSTRFQMTPEKRLIWGHSLGGAVAAQFAAKEGGQGLILESTFNNMIDMVGEIYPALPISLLCRHPFRSDDVLQHWKSPLVMFHSPSDSVVPYDLGVKLKNSLLSSVPQLKFITTEGRHNDGYVKNSELYRKVCHQIFPQWFRKIEE